MTNGEITILFSIGDVTRHLTLSFSFLLHHPFSRPSSLHMLIFIGVTLRRSSRLYFIFCAVFEIVLDIYHFQLSVLIVCALQQLQLASFSKQSGIQ